MTTCIERASQLVTVKGGETFPSHEGTHPMYEHGVNTPLKNRVESDKECLSTVGGFSINQKTGGEGVLVGDLLIQVSGSPLGDDEEKV